MNSLQSIPEQQIRAGISCFRDTAGRRVLPAWQSLWQDSLCASPLLLSSDEQEALARIVPLLVCGEQSAIVVFGSATLTHSIGDARRLQSAFAQIEFDESGHEAAWQGLHAALPQPGNLHQLKRRAQRFFARLGRSDTMGAHFAQVAQLDSVVGVMMWFLEHSAIARDSRIHTLASHIKRDEARHVSVSRQYAAALGVSHQEYAELGRRIRNDIVELLDPVGDALDTIGIDAERLFRRIDKTNLARLS